MVTGMAARPEPTGDPSQYVTWATLSLTV